MEYGTELASSALPANRLEALLNLASVDAAQALELISQSNLLAHLPSNEAQHKLTTRINSYISAQNPLGYCLAHLWLQQKSNIWSDHLVNHASTWAAQIVNLLSSPAKLLQRKDAEVLLNSAMELAIAHVFAENNPSRQEFHRQVVTPNLPKCIQALPQVLEVAIASNATSVVQVTLTATARLVQMHSAQFRPVSSKLMQLVTAYLARSEETPLPLPLLSAASHLLTTLHLTGALASKTSEASGSSERVTQAHLWQMTLSSHLKYATEAWRHAVSSYQDATDPPTKGKGGSVSSDSSPFKLYPKDPISATSIAHARLALFLGSRGRPGLLQLHLKTATPRPVPIPVGELLALASDMLHIDYSSRQKPTSEAKLCTLQAAHLSVLHTCALTLIAQVAVTAPKAFALQASSVLSDICRVVESNDTNSGSASALGSVRLRMAAFATLAMIVGHKSIGSQLDPAGRTVLRLARVSAGQVANAIRQPELASTPAVVDKSAPVSRKTKKARLYESDAVFGASSANPKDYVQTLSPEELASTISALDILTSAYPNLVTGLTAQHHDLARLTLSLTIALVEVLADSLPPSHAASVDYRVSGPTPDLLFVSALTTVAALCADAPSSTLALGVPRLIPVLIRLTQAAGNGGDTAIGTAAYAAYRQVDAATKGKYVPIAKGVIGFGPNADDDFEVAPENAHLSSNSILLDTDAGILEKELTSVLGARRAAPQEEIVGDDDETMEPSAIPTSPVRLPSMSATAEASAGFSPDPVKPARRAVTPRIGSPAASPSSSGINRLRPTSRASSPSFGRETSLGTSSLNATHPASTTSLGAITAQQVFGSVSPTLSSSKTSAAVQPLASLAHTQDEIKFEIDDDDDDEEMPEIDLGSSDDESNQDNDEE